MAATRDRRGDGLTLCLISLRLSFSLFQLPPPISCSYLSAIEGNSPNKI